MKTQIIHLATTVPSAQNAPGRRTGPFSSASWLNFSSFVVLPGVLMYVSYMGELTV